MPIKRKRAYFLQKKKKKKACSMRCCCKLSHNSVFSTALQGLQGNIPPQNHFVTDGWDATTQCNRRVLSWHRGSGSSHYRERRSQGSEHSSLKHSCCQGGTSRAKEFCNLKTPRIWYARDHYWHCKKIRIILLKQISLTIRCALLSL